LLWQFIIFAFIFAALTYAHFLLAYRSWRIYRFEQATDIDQSYVRLEDYFARSFRLKVSEWLCLPDSKPNPDGTICIRKGNETILVSNDLDYPPQIHSDEILIVRGSFRCLAGCVFNREIYIQGDAKVGAGTQLQAIAVDGNLILGHHIQVMRWVDCQGSMEIGEKSIIHSRATAGKSLLLQNGTQVKSAFAPLVHTFGVGAGQSAKFEQAAPPEINFPAGILNLENESPSSLTLDSKLLKKLSHDCWIYNGDFRPSQPLRVETKLIVQGDCDIPSGSILEKDIKSKRSLSIGAGSICRGNLISDHAMWIGHSCQFYGIVHAGQTLRICAGARGGTENSNVSAFAEETLTVEENVIIHGKLASGDYVIARPANYKNAMDSNGFN